MLSFDCDLYINAYVRNIAEPNKMTIGLDIVIPLREFLTSIVTIDEAASWNGLVCGRVRFTVATSNSTFSAGSIRIIVIHE